MHNIIDEGLISESYTDFTSKLTKVIDEIAPLKDICIRNNTEEWVDEEVFEGIRIRDKLFCKLKKT